MHPLLKTTVSNIAAGLRRKAITSCAKWAESYRIMGQPYPGLWNFKHHPWTYDVHNCMAEHIRCRKAAQMGFTETGLNVTFYNIDIHGYSVLYVLPASTPDASDFSTSRFDPALEMSPHLRTMFSDVRNIGHKRAGNANLFIRGSRSRSQLKSLPVSIIILDEVDEMREENIPLALMRQTGQNFTQDWMFSTPTIPAHGIEKYYQQSNQSEWTFKCPHCSKYITLRFPESLVITSDDDKDAKIEDSHLICTECRHPLAHEDKINFLSRDNAKWVPLYPSRAIAGFGVSQLYGMNKPQHPSKIAVAYLQSLRNPADDQEFYNSRLGLTRVPQGSQITDEQIENCLGTYTMPSNFRENQLVTMGVDVGTWLHCEIARWYVSKDIIVCKVLRIVKVKEFAHLLDLMKDYRVQFTVIDSQPEHRVASAFAQTVPGRVKLCIYGRGIAGQDLKNVANDSYQIVVNRTAWLDTSLGRFKRQTITLPKDVPLEYREHLKAPVKIYKKDPDGNPFAVYVTGDGVADHFAHARNYCEIAFQCVRSLFQSEDITKGA